MASITRPLSGRREEREILLRLVNSKKAEFLAIYGRRRVGKTFLVRRFCQDQPVTYFEMVGRFGGALEVQLQIFSEALSAAFHQGAKLAPPANWHEAFQLLRSAITAHKKKKKLVIFSNQRLGVAPR
ncbi:MAG TPA: hypothetical protein VJN18_33230 [Polyangiaceae bacterium]|nr:hypothetical protein [Polyangiaceae bacterium]